MLPTHLRVLKESNPHLLGLESSALTIRPKTHYCRETGIWTQTIECIRLPCWPLHYLPIYSTHLRLPTYDRLNASYGLGNYGEFATSHNSVPPSCRIFLMFVIPTNLLISTSLHSDLIEYNWLRKWELNPTAKVMSLACDHHTASAI